MNKCKHGFLLLPILVIALLVSFCGVNLANSKNKSDSAHFSAEQLASEAQDSDNDIMGVYIGEEDTGASSADVSLKSGAVFLEPNSTFTMNDGTIEGHSNKYGGAIYVSTGATFTMNGGTITGCSASYGGAIYVENGGKCIINLGTINNCKASVLGPTIYAESGAVLEISAEANVSAWDSGILLLRSNTQFADNFASSIDAGKGYAKRIDENSCKILVKPNDGYIFLGVASTLAARVTEFRVSKVQTEFVVPYHDGDMIVAMFYKLSDADVVVVNSLEYLIFSAYSVAMVNREVTAPAVKSFNNYEAKLKGGTDTVESYVKASSGSSYYEVSLISADFQPAADVVVLPSTICYIQNGAFSNKVTAISAPDEVLSLFDDKISLSLELELEHFKALGEVDNPQAEMLSMWLNFNLCVSLTDTSSGEIYKLTYSDANQDKEKEEDAAFTLNQPLAFIGVEKGHTYNLSVSNDVTENYAERNESDYVGLSRMTESVSIKLNGTSIFEIGEHNVYSNINPDFSQSLSDPIKSGDALYIALWYTFSTEGSYNPCFVEGSLVTLADGTAKPVEDITYDDLLLVWDFNTGTYSYSYPMWITRRLVSQKYYVVTFEDGTQFCNVVAHRLYSTDEDYFVKSIDAARSQVGHSFFAVNTDANGNAIYDENHNITFTEKKVVSIEIVHKEVYYYNLMTGYSINAFVNSILSSSGMSNMYGSTAGMKIDEQKMLERMSDPSNLYSLEELDVPAYFYYGLRLAEQKGVRTIEDIESYVAQDLLAQRDIELDSQGRRLWIVSTSFNNQFVDGFDKIKVAEGDYYMLEEPKDKANFKGWYCSADGKIYKPGDRVQIFMGTHFTAVYD